MEAPIYPLEAEARGMSESMIGIIFATHPAFALLFSLLLGQYMHGKGKKLMMMTGCILQSIGYLTYALMYWVQYDMYGLFLFLSIIGRIGSGVGAAVFLTPSYSLLPQFYREDIQKKIMYFEIYSGLGVSTGAIIASMLYRIGGY